MKRIVCLLFTLVAMLAGNMAYGHDDRAVPAGAVAAHFLGRISLFGETDPPELVGYYAFIEGIPGPFFNGTAGVDTAYFTLRYTAGQEPPIPLDPGADVFVSIVPAGASVDVYFDRDPQNQDWANPDSFSDGKLVATFEESVLSTTFVGENPLLGPGVSYNLFSSKLIYSKRFRFHGKTIDFKELFPNGLTTSNFGSATPVMDPLLDSFVTQAFSGSSIAIGGNATGGGGHKHHH